MTVATDLYFMNHQGPIFLAKSYIYCSNEEKK